MAWDVTRDLLTVRDRLEHLFGHTASGWVPAVDLYETGDRYILTVELPGCRREDVRVEMADDALVVTGERPAATTADRLLQIERGQGAFSRSFRFGQAIEAGAITAELVDGVLTVIAPKTAPPNGTRIAIS
jgi:HSP20 family protein